MSNSKKQKVTLSSITATFVENNSFLKHFLVRYFSNAHDIEDVAQEAFLKSYQAELNKGSIEHPKAFLFKVARNIALKKLSKQSRIINENIEELCDSGVLLEYSAESEVEASEALGKYCEAISTLPFKCREVFLLRKVHGLSHKEIAARMSLSISSVEKYLKKSLLVCNEYNRRVNTPSPAAMRKRTADVKTGSNRK